MATAGSAVRRVNRNFLIHAKRRRTTEQECSARGIKGTLGAAMKVKKALKRLHRVETIHTTVIERYAGRKGGLRDLLDAEKGRVVRATETLTVPSSTRKQPAKATAKRKG